MDKAENCACKLVVKYDCQQNYSGSSRSMDFQVIWEMAVETYKSDWYCLEKLCSITIQKSRLGFGISKKI